MANKIKKKSYNPFKMIGSWLGAYLLPVVFVFIANKDKTIIGVVNGLTWFLELHFFDDFSRAITVSILGFLIGWGIHSLIKKFK